MSKRQRSPQAHRWQQGREADFADALEGQRRAIQLHCYRLLGALQDAEDATQETLLRAWRARRTFAGRGSLRAWLYRIATNVCLTALARRPRRILPPAFARAASPSDAVQPPLGEPIWLEPYPDDLIDWGSPEEAVVRRETVTLAFMEALHALSPRQRAALILRDVLEFSARETAAVLGLSTGAANSLLYRARRTLQRRGDTRAAGPAAPVLGVRAGPTGEAAAHQETRTADLLRRYVSVWERGDVQALVALLARDAHLTMPPSPTWYAGRSAIVAFLQRVVLVPGARWRLLATRVNGSPAFGLYREAPGGSIPLGVHVLEIVRGRITSITAFMNPALPGRLGLPSTIATSSTMHDR
jgi:RNA polymerase sigma-70 factor (ECF subfamily)